MSRKQTIMLIASSVITVIAFIAVTLTNSWVATFTIFHLRISAYIGAIIIALIIGGLGWLLKLQTDETPNWFITVVAVFALVSMLGGIIFTEPTSRSSTANTNADTSFRSYGTYIYLFGDVVDSGSEVASNVDLSSSGDSDNIGYVIIAILLLMIVVGSFIIPHFWVAGSIAIIGVLWMFTLKEMWDNRD